MSIASEITRLQGVKSDILQAIASKGVNVPVDSSLNDCVELIGSIKAGTTAPYVVRTSGEYNQGTVIQGSEKIRVKLSSQIFINGVVDLSNAVNNIIVNVTTNFNSYISGDIIIGQYPTGKFLKVNDYNSGGVVRKTIYLFSTDTNSYVELGNFSFDQSLILNTKIAHNIEINLINKQLTIKLGDLYSYTYSFSFTPNLPNNWRIGFYTSESSATTLNLPAYSTIYPKETYILVDGVDVLNVDDLPNPIVT